MLSAPAMHNAYYICHNVQVLISYIAKTHDDIKKNQNLYVINKHHNFVFHNVFDSPGLDVLPRFLLGRGAPGKREEGEGEKEVMKFQQNVFVQIANCMRQDSRLTNVFARGRGKEKVTKSLPSPILNSLNP